MEKKQLRYPQDVSVEIDRFVKMKPEQEKAYVKSRYDNFMARFEEDEL